MTKTVKNGRITTTAITAPRIVNEVSKNRESLSKVKPVSREYEKSNLTSD